MISIMCLNRKVNFLTFVLFLNCLVGASLAIGAPTNDIPPVGIKLNDDKEYFFASKTVRHTIDLGIGAAEGIFDKDKEKKSLTFFSIGRSHYQDNKTAYEYQILLSSQKWIGISADYRWIFPEIFPEEPYAKLGAAILLDPQEQFANIIDYERYYLQAAIGFDDLFHLRRSIKLELGCRQGVAGAHYFANFIYGFAD